MSERVDEGNIRQSKKGSAATSEGRRRAAFEGTEAVAQAVGSSQQGRRSCSSVRQEAAMSIVEGLRRQGWKVSILNLVT